MTTLATAPDLPSDDEEDDDYVPCAADDGDDAGTEGASQKGGKRKKGAAAALDGVATARAAKQAKRVDDIWSQLRAQSSGSASTSAPSSAQPGGGGGSGSAAAPAAKQSGFNLAAFCRAAPKPKKGVVDESWKKQFGLGPRKQKAPATGQPDAKAIAAAALEAAKSIATTDQYGRAIVTETRKFAGQNVQIRKSVAAGSAAKEAAQKRAASGLDAMLAAIQGAKKVTVLDKSKADWNEHKKEAGVDAELAGHNRSADRFLDKQDFLARSEVREYEKERDARLNSDVRNRSRA